MIAMVALVTDPADDTRLNETDRAIISRLQAGRETTGSLAEGLDKHPQTIRDRLKWLREWGYVQHFHKPTGLHEFTPGDDNE
jgi:DNA-binding transcriptional ArsR family regulator